MRKQHGQLHEGPDTCHESQFNLYKRPIEIIGVGVPSAKLTTQQPWSSRCQSGTDFMKQLCVLTDIASQHTQLQRAHVRAQLSDNIRSDLHTILVLQLDN
jgi:hypothetical protein